MKDIKTEYFFSKIAIILASLFLLFIFFLLSFLIYFSFSLDSKIVLIFCLFILFLFLKSFQSFYIRIKFYLADTPALILTKDELIDNTNLQIFQWKDIKAISAKSINIRTRVNYIAISLIDPYKYIDLIENPYKRIIAILNHKFFGGAFSIQPNIIKCNNAELLKDLSKYIDENK